MRSAELADGFTGTTGAGLRNHSAHALLQRSAAHLSTVGFAAALIYGTFAFGAATAGTRNVLDIILLFSALFGAIAVTDLRGQVRSMAVPIALTMLILAQAGIAISNPSHGYDAELGSLLKLKSTIVWLPSSADPESSLPELRHLGSMLLSLLVLIALFRDNARRWQILSMIAVCGAGVAIAGITQKLVDAPSLLWVDKAYHEHQKTFFAAFRYHGHAAAFLNLCWPAALALLVRAMAKPKHKLARLLWAATLLLILSGLLFNTSKYGHLSLVPAVISAACLFRHFYSSATLKAAFTKKTAMITLIAAAIALAVAWPVATRSIGNWAWELENHGSSGGRLAVYSVCVDMIKSAGPFGFGSGTYHRLIPYFAVANSANISGVWTHAHQDYLQTIIEWGWLGTLPWLALVGGAFYRHLFRSRLRSKSEPRPKPLTLSIAASLIAVVFLAVHALIDFPLRIGSIQLCAVVYLAILWSDRNSRRDQPPMIQDERIPTTKH